MQQEDKDIILEKLENHDKRLDDHEQKITRNIDDISDIKVNAAIQETTVKTLNKSMDRLTDTINKLADKFDAYLIDGGKQNSSNWQWKVGILIAMGSSIILMLMNWLHK